MDEMTLLEDLGRDLESRPPATLARQRARLEEAARSPRRPRRLALTTGALTAAASISIAVGTATVTHPAWLRHHATPTPTPTVLDAAYVLSRAADTVETRPAVHPRANQWAYTKQVSTPELVQVPDPRQPTSTIPPQKPLITERWVRFDGTQEASLGAMYIGDDPDHLRIYKTKTESDEKTPLQAYAYLASLPTDTDALVKRICPDGSTPMLLNACVFAMAARYLPDVTMPPRLLAAVYRALSRLPYVTVRRDVIDLAGRHDLAIAEAYPGDFQSEEILLDPTTYEYRGEQPTWTQGGPLVSPNGATAVHDTTASARLAAGIVDRPGARP